LSEEILHCTDRHRCLTDLDMGSIQIDESFYAAPPQVHSFHGILSDFDGTIIDSGCPIQALILYPNSKRIA
jgi:hypothetical protein